MTLIEHISDEIFDRYARRTANSSEILQVQTHIAACAACRGKMARVVNEEKAFSAAIHADFGFDDLADEPEHLAYEQLEFFADDKLDEVDREVATSHLAICSECTKDLNDLQMYRKIAATAPAANVSEPVAESSKRFLWQRLFAFDSISKFAPITAIVLIAVIGGAWFFLLRGNQNGGEMAKGNVNQHIALSNFNAGNNSTAPNTSPQISPEVFPKATEEDLPNSETQFALNDGQLKIDDKGNVQGAQNLSPVTQNLIKQSLQSGKISIANNLPGGGSGVLMSESNAENGVPFPLLTPIGKVILENQPELRWKPLKDAQSYSVAIVDEKFRVVAESGKLSGTSWKPSKALPRGANYSWQVTAVKADGSETVSPSSPAPQARFRVVEQSLFDELNRLKQSGKASHLALGVLYAKAGLRQEARTAFEQLAKENPNSPLARKLLQSVK